MKMSIQDNFTNIQNKTKFSVFHEVKKKLKDL